VRRRKKRRGRFPLSCSFSDQEERKEGRERDPNQKTRARSSEFRGRGGGRKDEYSFTISDKMKGEEKEIRN